MLKKQAPIQTATKPVDENVTAAGRVKQTGPTRQQPSLVHSKSSSSEIDDLPGKSRRTAIDRKPLESRSTNIDVKLPSGSSNKENADLKHHQHQSHHHYKWLSSQQHHHHYHPPTSTTSTTFNGHRHVIQSQTRGAQYQQPSSFTIYQDREHDEEEEQDVWSDVDVGVGLAPSVIAPSTSSSAVPKPEYPNSDTDTTVSEVSSSVSHLCELPSHYERARKPLATLEINTDSVDRAAARRNRHEHRELDAVKRTNHDLFDTTMESAKSGSPMSVQSSTTSPDKHIDVLDIGKPSVIDEDAQSLFLSAPSETSLSEYYTAPPATEKELHLDYVIAVPEYCHGVYEYLRHREKQVRPASDNLRKQRDITKYMRVVLIDWLIDVAYEYDLQPETLHLAVKYVDLALTLRAVEKPRLQLVGTTACMLAAKYEEIYPPELSEFVYITDDTYTRDDVLRMERCLLKDVLHFNCAVVTPIVFLAYFAKICRSPNRTRFLAQYLCDLSLLDHDFLAFLPSQIAGAAICLANLMTGPIPWPEHLEQACGMDITAIYECVKRLLECYRNAPNDDLKAVYNKYTDQAYHQVALIEPPDSLPDISVDQC